MLKFYTEVHGDPDKPQYRYVEISGSPYKLCPIRKSLVNALLMEQQHSTVDTLTILVDYLCIDNTRVPTVGLGSQFSSP